MKRILGFRSSLTLLIAIALLPAIVMIVWRAVAQHRLVGEHAEDTYIQLIREIAGQQSSLINEGRSQLITLSYFPEIQEGESSLCSPILRNFLADFPEYNNIVVMSVDGKVVCSALDDDDVSSIASQEWFQKAITTKKFAISDVMISRVNGRRVVGLALPIVGEHNEVKRVIGASVRMEWLTARLDNISLPEEATILVVDHNGNILAGSSEDQMFVGQIMTGQPVFETALQQKEGSISGRGPDGENFFYAFSRISRDGEDPLIMLVGVPNSVLYHSVNRLILIELGGLLLVILLAMAAAWFGGERIFLTRIKHLINTTQRFAAGEFSVRTELPHDTSELSRLAYAFDQMADRLANRTGELQQVVAALEVSEARFRILAETTRSAIFIFKENRFIYVNRACKELTRYTIEEFLSVHLSDLIHPDDLEDFVRYSGTSQQNADWQGKEVRVRRKDGDWLWVEFSGATIDYGGETATIGTAFDITDRHRAEELLRESEASFRLLFANHPYAMWVYDLETLRFLEVNDCAVEQYGYTRDEFLRMTLLDIRPEEDLPQFLEWLSEVRPALRQSTHWRHKTKQGRVFPVSLRSHTLEFAGREASLVVVQDISEQRMVEQSINRKMEELTALHAISLAGTAATSLDELFEAVTQIIGEKFYPTNFGVLIFYEDEGAFRFHPSYRIRVEARHLVLPLGTGVIGTVGQTGKPILVPDVTKCPFYLAGEPEARSELCVPIWTGNRLFGVINTESDDLNGYTDSDLHLLSAVAGELSIGIEKLRLFEAERRRRYEAETLREASAALISTLDFDQVMEDILFHLGRVVPYISTSIMLLEDGRLHITAQRGFRHSGQEKLFFFCNDFPHINQVITQCEPVIIADTHLDPRWTVTKGSEYIHCWMGIPLKIKDRVIGLLNLDYDQPNFYDQDQVQLAVGFSYQAAAAIENARLFQAEQQRSQELETFARVSSATRSATKREEMIPVVLAQLMDALKAGGAVIAFMDADESEVKVDRGDGVWADLSGGSLPWANPLIQSVFRNNQTVRVDNLTVLPDGSAYELFTESRSFLAVPLIAQERTFGMLCVGRSQAFNPEDEQLMGAIADTVANALYRANLYDQTEKRLHRLSVLHSVETAIAASIDIKLTLSVLLDETLKGLDLDAADILIYNRPTRTLEWVGSRGFESPSLMHYNLVMTYLSTLDPNHPVLEAVRENRPVLVDDLSRLDPRRSLYLHDLGIRNAVIVPFIVKRQLKGILQIYSRTPIRFDSEFSDFLEALAGQAAVAIDNAQLFSDLEHSNLTLSLAYDATIEGWSRALDLRDRETEGHTQRVTDLTLQLGRAMKFNEEELIHIRRGALLHDIGKMGIPDHILMKPGPLTPDEWEIMRQHPSLAYQMLSPISFLRPALDIPYCHHERWDGNGYPRGLKGEEIPPAARIFSVVDVWDALLSDRPYRRAWTKDQVRSYLIEQSGKQFDPQIVEIFLNSRL